MFDKVYNIPKDCFRVSETVKNAIEIPFDEIFGEDIGFLNAFQLNKKRAYINIAEEICTNNNIILERLENKEDIIYNYLAIKYAIDVQQYDSIDEFIKQMREYIVDETIDVIKEYVDENYQFNLDEVENDTDKKFKEGLQFKDIHNKILFRVSVAMKFCIPLILHWGQIYGEQDISQFLLKCFDTIFDAYSENGTIDILNKLYESVYSRVIVTRYSDRVFWYHFEIMGITIASLSDELCKKLICDIVPKYKFDSNPISLNHVAIQKNIGYAFRINYALKFKSMNLTEQTNDDDISDFDRLSVNTAKINESDQCINTVNIKQTIKTLPKKLGVTLDKEEIKYYLKNFKLNKLQRNLLFLFYAHYFGSTNALYFCGLKEYVILLVIMKKYLEKNGFTYLNRILTSTVADDGERRTLNKKNLTKVVESEKYNNIVATNYSDSMFSVLDSNAILKFVSTLSTNDFIDNEYNGENNGELIEIDHNVISDELLKLVAMI